MDLRNDALEREGLDASMTDRYAANRETVVQAGIVIAPEWKGQIQPAEGEAIPGGTDHLPAQRMHLHVDFMESQRGFPRQVLGRAQNASRCLPQRVDDLLA